jgi:hypothetical protein
VKLQLGPVVAIAVMVVVLIGKNEPDGGVATTAPQSPIIVGAGKHLLFVLKENNPDLLTDAKGLFAHQSPLLKQEGRNLYQRWDWDEEGFGPWPETKRLF